MKRFQHDKKWEKIAHWSHELGIPSWSTGVACMKTIHPRILMGSRLSVQRIMDGGTVTDQFAQKYSNGPSLVTLCAASESTCEYCSSSRRFHTFVMHDRSDSDGDFMLVAQQAARAMHGFLQQNKTVLVHCHSGRNRSALVVLVYCAMFTPCNYSNALLRVRTHNSKRFPPQQTLSNVAFRTELQRVWDELKRGK